VPRLAPTLDGAEGLREARGERRCVITEMQGCAPTHYGPVMRLREHILQNDCVDPARVRTGMADVRYMCRRVWVREAPEIADVVENGLYT